jgi:hypothetical protein
MAAITLVYMTEITIFFLVFVAADYAWILGLERMSGCCEMLGRITAPDADQKEVCAFNETNRNVRNLYFALLAVAVLTVAIDAVFIPNH